MANDEPVFGKPLVTPVGTIFSANFDTENTKEKHPNAKFHSDRFDAEIGVDKDTDLKTLRDEVESVAKKAFGTTDGIDLPFSNGDESSWAPKKGKITFRAKCTKRPGCVNENKERILEADFTPGMKGKLQVSPASYVSGRNKGVRLIIKNLQILTNEDYTPIGGAESAEDAF